MLRVTAGSSVTSFNLQKYKVSLLVSLLAVFVAQNALVLGDYLMPFPCVSNLKPSFAPHDNRVSSHVIYTTLATALQGPVSISREVIVISTNAFNLT